MIPNSDSFSVDPGLVPQTRIHPINLLPGHPAQTFLKREDEAGFAIAGGKKRKLASLIPWLHSQGISTVTLLGGANSNNVLAALQLFREQNIRPIVFQKAGEQSNSGNGLLTRLLINPDDLHLVQREEWPQATEIAREHADSLTAQGLSTWFLPEGSTCLPSFPGAMTLGTDIQHNEQQAGLRFDHVFVDAGTGHSAAALALQFAEANHPAQVHIVLMAEDEEAFEAKMKEQFRPWFEKCGGSKSSQANENYLLYRPENARSFGSVNRRVLNAIQRYAQDYGVLTDPIYSAKLLMEAERIISQNQLGGNILIVHSGGVQTLPGFAGKLFPEQD